jgi:glycosyltransferase involved in cell wall biosynthesis
MKILIINDFDEIVWWAERVYQNQYSYLKNKWYNVTKLWWKNKSKFIINRILNINFFYRLKKELRKEEYDIIHIHKFSSNLWFLLIPILKKYLTNSKIIWHCHDFSIFCPHLWVQKDWKLCNGSWMHLSCRTSISRGPILDYIYGVTKYFFMKTIRLVVSRYVDQIIVPSEYLKTCLNFFDKDKIAVIPNYVNINRSLKWIWIEDYLLFVWRVSKEKWIDILLLAANDLKKKWKNFNILVIWDWPNLKEYKNRVLEYWLNNHIRFLGPIENEHLWSYYQNSIATIIPSICLENNPLVAIETLFYNKPIIWSNIWWIPELVIHWENWFLFDVYDSSMLWEYIQIIMSDKSLRERMNKKSKEMSKKYTEDFFYKELFNLYKRHI